MAPFSELPELESPRPWHAFAREPRAPRHVAFVEVGGDTAVAVVAGDVLTLIGLDGRPLGAPRALPAGGRPHTAMSGGGPVLLVCGLPALDLEAMTTLGEPREPRSVSWTGQTFAGSGASSPTIEIWARGATEIYPPPLPPQCRPLAVTDRQDLLFAAGNEVRYYDYHRDESDSVIALGRAKHVAASADGAFVARATNTVTRLHTVPSGDEVAKVSRFSPEAIAAGSGGRLAVGAWDGKVVLVGPEGRASLRVAGRVTSLAFSAAGDRLAIGCDDARVTVVPTEGEVATPPSRPSIVAMCVGRSPLLALRSGRVVEAGDPPLEHLPDLDRPEGRDSLARSERGPVHVRCDRDGAWWRGAFEGAAERPEGVVGHVLAPDGTRLLLWVAAPQRLRPHLPRFAPELRDLDLDSGSERVHPVHGPVAFFDAHSVLAFAIDDEDATIPVRLDLASGTIRELDRSNRNLPVQAIARGEAWALQRADASLTVHPDPDRRWKLGLRSLPGGSGARAPLLAIDSERLVLVHGRRVYVHDLADGTLTGEYELPFGIREAGLHEGALVFPRQDGDLGRLDLESGESTTQATSIAAH